ncbi:HalD/BesD family halogenase [Protofrankia coriariae]|uniref:ArpA protein n=1 Tax=Protofrankia coriariae TaxID=1562887 RepID=A0ABR5F669_9ACTN|nr:ArpA protein [Protofrankia coriariae]KLL12227.1 arpA protein [Protofrankia coriariae]
MIASEARLIEQVVSATCYPLTEPGGADWEHVVSRTRQELHAHGCSILHNFIQPARREEIRLECAAVAPRAYYDVETVNAYNIATDVDLPADHPGRLPMRRGNAFVARDRIPDDFVIHRLYASELFQNFIASCFELPRVHELADPLAGLCLNVVTPGMEHPWHFDTNEFAVSLLTQEPEDGGAFEYCPGIRSTTTENFADVRAVLAGRGGHLIRRVSLRPGDLQLFRGRYSMHRVSAVRGGTARHSAIFSYSERPGVVGSVERTRQLFGRVLPEHLAAAGHAVRVDQLLD